MTPSAAGMVASATPPVSVAPTTAATTATPGLDRTAARTDSRKSCNAAPCDAGRHHRQIGDQDRATTCGHDHRSRARSTDCCAGSVPPTTSPRSGGSSSRAPRPVAARLGSSTGHERPNSETPGDWAGGRVLAHVGRWSPIAWCAREDANLHPLARTRPSTALRASSAVHGDPATDEVPSCDEREVPLTLRLPDRSPVWLPVLDDGRSSAPRCRQRHRAARYARGKAGLVIRRIRTPRPE